MQRQQYCSSIFNRTTKTQFLGLFFFSILTFFLSSCITATNYGTIKTYNQDTEELNSYLKTKPVILIHHYNFETKSFQEAKQLITITISDKLITGNLSSANKTFHEVGANNFQLKKEYINKKSEVDDENFIEPRNALHIYYFSSPEELGFIKVDRSKIVSYDIHNLESSYCYSVDKKSLEMPFDSFMTNYIITENKVVVVNSGNLDFVLAHPQYGNNEISGTLVRSSKLLKHPIEDVFEYPIISDTTEAITYLDTMIHPLDVLNIETINSDLKAGPIVLHQKDIANHYIHKKSNMTKQKKHATGKGLTAVVIVVGCSLIVAHIIVTNSFSFP